MPIQVRLFTKSKILNESDAQTISNQIAQLQQMQLDVEKKTSLQIQNIQKQAQQKIDTIKAKIIKLQSDLTASNGTIAQQSNVSNNQQTTNQTTNQNAGTSANQ